MHRSLARVSALALVGGSGIIAHADWPTMFNVERIGLFDSAHTGNAGTQISELLRVTPEGFAFGASNRFATGGSSNGRSVWCWSPESGTIQIGLLGAEYFGSGGNHFSSFLGAARGGWAIGNSRNVATGDLMPWVWNPSTGVAQIGIDGSGYDASSVQLVAQGAAAGHANALRTNGSILGRVAWGWSSSLGAAEIGLRDAVHEKPDGARVSEARSIGLGGHVIGTSERTGVNSSKVSHWMWDPASGETRLIDPGSIFHRFDGSISMLGVRAARDGSVFGSAGDARGILIDTHGFLIRPGADPVILGLEGELYHAPRSEIVRATRLAGVNSGGLVGGTNKTYVRAPGTLHAGRTAWVWNEDSGYQIAGLYDGDHASASGVSRNSVRRVHDGGFVIGDAEFQPSASSGQSLRRTAWIWSEDAGTITMGLHDGPHASGSNRRSEFVRANSHGQVIGVSWRYPAGGSGSTNGQSGWFFDLATEVTTPLIFSVSADGRAWTEPQVFSRSGIVYGWYTLYLPGSETAHAFAWSPENGMTDLGELIDGGLSGAGIERLRSVAGPGDMRALIAEGRLLGSSELSNAVFALTPLVPAPGALVVLGSVLLGASRRRM
jgi:hypothetical protein